MRRRTPLSPADHTIRVTHHRTNPHLPALHRATAVAAAGLAAAGALLGAASAQAADVIAPPTSAATPASPSTVTGSIHEESSRIAAAAYRAKAAKQRAHAVREAELQRIRDAVVDKALAQVGDSYGAGGDGPNVFDCSGLVVYAWRSVGVDLEHYSWSQYKQTERISLKDAVPGDLAFYFENGAHHVAIYIGDGKVVQASDYGIGVVKGTVKDSPWTRDHFTGMGRVEIKI